MRSLILRCMLAVIVTVVFLVLPTCVTAAELIVHLGSQHGKSPNGTDYNNVNPGIGFVSDEDTLGGLYFNSYSKWSPYVGKQLLYKDTVGVWAGVAFNYGAVSSTGMLVVGGFVLKVPVVDNDSIRIYHVPRTNRSARVTHIAFSHRF